MNGDELPFSGACERNRDPILGVLREAFADATQVLEVGSGSGQHAAYFAAAMPWLTWQCSDRAEHLPGLRRRLAEAALSNTPAPLALDVAVSAWPRSPRADGRFDAAFSANTLHIMGWPEVETFFAALDAVLAAKAMLVVYGPFTDAGRFDSESNRDFDASLKARDPRMGLRDVEAVDALAGAIGLRMTAVASLPANNRCLVWQRTDGGT